MMPRIIVQGGAYSKKIYVAKTRQAYLGGIRKAARQGYEVLRKVSVGIIFHVCIILDRVANF